MFRAEGLASDQVGDVRQASGLVEAHEVRLDFARAHQMDASENHSIDIQQWLHVRRRFFLKQLPLRRGEAQIVVRMMAGDAIRRERFQFVVLRRGVNHQRRQQLLKHVAVFLQQQAEKLFGIVRDQVDFQAVVDAGALDRFVLCMQTEQLRKRQKMHASQVEIGIGRGKSIQMRRR